MRYCLYEPGIYPLDLVVAMNEEKGSDEDKRQLELVMTPKSNVCVDGCDAITFPATFNQDGTNVVCVLFNGPQLEGVWVHEADHFANMLFTILGIELDTNNDETHAYLVEWAFCRIKDFFTDYITRE